MAIEKYNDWNPGTIDDDTPAYRDIPEGKPLGDVTELDVETLVRLVSQSTEITDRIIKRDAGRAPAWAKGEGAKTVAWSVVVPTLVSGMANFAAHQWPGWEVPVTGGIVTVVTTVALVSGLNRNWNPTALSVTAALSVGSVQFTAAAGGGGWTEVVAWLVGAASVLAYKVVWNRKHAESRAKEENIRAKTDTERAKADATRMLAQLKATHEMLRIENTRKAAIQPVPYLGGVTSEEAAIRSAVWEVHQETLLTCELTPTRTGWTAAVGLPAGLPRKEARASWDRVASAMRLDGRMKATDGQRTNELLISYVDNALTSIASSLGWSPGDSWATVADTGVSVPVPLGRRILLAGTSGSGKSWSARPLMAEASEYDDHRLVLVDLKQVEARNWQHRARIATEPDQVDRVSAELISEGERRLKQIPRGKDVVEISAAQPRITVFVDEGGELLSSVSDEVIGRFRTIARKYRAAEIILVWATQKPTLTGQGAGLDSQIAAQLTHKLSLAVSTPSESRVVFGEDAADKGWDAHELPMPGWAYLRDIESQADPMRLRMRAMSPQHVIDLPPRPVWFTDGDRAFEGDDQYQGLMTSSMLERESSPADKVARFLAEHPRASQAEIARETGVPRTTVQRVLKGN